MKIKKGYALVLVLVIISVLLVLSASVLSLSTSAYVNTQRVESDNKLKLVAESGIDKAKVIIKNYTLANSSDISSINFALINSNPDFDSDVNFEMGGIDCKLEFGPANPTDTFPDGSTNRNISYISVVSTATDSKGNKKSISVIYDKNALMNVYFNQIFNSSITTTIKDSSDTSPSFDTNGTDLNVTGNMYLQGHIVNLDPGTFHMGEGNIYVKTSLNGLNWNGIDPILTSVTKNTGELPIVSPAVGKYISGSTTIPTGWQSKVIRDMKVLNILAPTQTLNKLHPDDIHDLDKDSDLNKLSDYIEFKSDSSQLKPTDLPQLPTLLTYKCKSTSPIDFIKLVDGPNKHGDVSGIYYSIFTNLYDRNVKEMDPINDDKEVIARDNAKKDYGTFYKLLLVDGDLDIEDDSTENFNNYLIYCTGTVTFKGEAHFYNSSVFANKIKMISNTPAKIVEFYGPNTEKAKSPGIDKVNISDFSPQAKNLINTYLINNLENYGDYIDYKIIQWK